ncbi:uncharacterized protein LOC134741621 isoform X1 [Cydia strobilella]|uniref:uncharacterized protein LOC134741621 isoform X1 n=2 Tax=Cydia strobilella TaxID=1100964 RepID=UPI003004EB3B
MAAIPSSQFPKKRELPKLMACMTKSSVDNMRNNLIYAMDALDSNAVRRRKLPLHECLILELREAGYRESSDYIQDLLYDNMQLVMEDDIGIIVDLTKRPDYLEHICGELQKAEKERDKGNTKSEALYLLGLALCYAEKGKGILWLAEKFYMASIAVASQYLVDGGRQKGCCKYHYAKFLLDKFPGVDQDEPFQMLTQVRDSAIGKSWLLYEPAEGDQKEHSNETLFKATALQLHRVLISQARTVRKQDPGKAERLARLAERRAVDAEETDKTADAIIEIGICQLAINNLNNAQKTFERAFKIHTESNNIEGICDCKMHMAAVMQKLGDHETAAKLLTEMGSMAMEHGLRLQLGRALHLIGELHLRRERPELGTQHLKEAFACFMGFNWQFPGAQASMDIGNIGSELGIIFENKTEVYEEEAEQSRLMMAISSGQEKMSSYFSILKEAKDCTIAKMKIIEWKLSLAPWWMKRTHHNFLPCPCAQHHRTPLDVLRTKLEFERKQMEMQSREETLQRNKSAQQLTSENVL